MHRLKRTLAPLRTGFGGIGVHGPRRFPPPTSIAAAVYAVHPQRFRTWLDDFQASSSTSFSLSSFSSISSDGKPSPSSPLPHLSKKVHGSVRSMTTAPPGAETNKDGWKKQTGQEKEKDKDKERQATLGTKSDPTSSWLDPHVRRINFALQQYPQESIVFLFASDLGSIFGTYALFQLLGVSFSPEFALAFAASRPLRRLRFPLDLAAAAVLARVVPATTQIQLSILSHAFMPPRPSKNASNGVDVNDGHTVKEQKRTMPSLFTRGVDQLKQVVDKYGAAYLIGSRCVGVVSVFTLYAAIHHGLDLMPLLAKVGLGEDVGNALGSWAAAVVLSSTVYPLTLGLTGYVVPTLGQLRQTLRWV